mgnify:CR=1 FL=1
MKGIESNDKQELEKINKKINDYMYKKIKDYNAIQWGKIIKNQFIENKFFLILVDDNRDPLNKSENYARELRDLKQS